MSANFEKRLDSLCGVLFNPRSLFAVALAVLCSKLLQSPGADPDLFARIAMGRLIARDGAVPLQDPFAYTRVKPLWIDHEWLSGLVFYYISQFGGDAALLSFNLLICAATVYCVLRASSLLSDKASAAVWVVTLGLLLDCSYVWASTVRSQAFTYFFVALFFLLFARYSCSRGKINLLVQPFLMVLWCNAHGGFTIGLIIQGFFALHYLLLERRAAYFMLPLVSLLATLVNPYGFEYWRYIIEALGMARPSITEWFPTYPWHPSGIFPFSVLLLFIAGCWKSGPNNTSLRMLILFFAYCGFRHNRLMALFTLSLAALGSRELQAGLKWLLPGGERLQRSRRALGLVVAVLALFYASTAVFQLSKLGRLRLSTEWYPVAAVEWLWHSGRGGDLLVDFNNGSFALWRLFPKYRISLDGRYEELYPESTVQTVSRALSCPIDQDQKRALSDVWPDYILAPIGLECFERDNEFRSEWNTVYEDSRWRVYSRGQMFGGGSSQIPVRDLWKPGF